MKNKINYWKVISIIFIVLIIFLSTFLIIRKNQKYNFGNFEIKKSQFNNIANFMEGKSKGFIICDIETDKCVRISSFT